MPLGPTITSTRLLDEMEPLETKKGWEEDKLNASEGRTQEIVNIFSPGSTSKKAELVSLSFPRE